MSLPKNLLDEQTQITVLICSCISSLAVGSSLFVCGFVILPKLKQRVAAAAKHNSQRRNHSTTGVSSSSSSSLQRQQPPPPPPPPPPVSLLKLGLWCLYTLTWMAVLSAGITCFLIYVFGEEPPAAAAPNNNNPKQQQSKDMITSSINFCEVDYQDSPYIAETANTASSLGCYVPLALIGLLGPPSQQWRRRRRRNRHDNNNNTTTTTLLLPVRFALCYTTLLAIGLGSTALHALLTAQAQGGDELPMLWYCGAVVFCLMDNIIIIILQQRQQQQQQQQQYNNTSSSAECTTTTATTSNATAAAAAAAAARYAVATNGSSSGSTSNKRLHTAVSGATTTTTTTTTTTILAWTVLGTTVGATAFYVLFRDNFFFFYIIFTLYVYCIIVGFSILFIYWPWKKTRNRELQQQQQQQQVLMNDNDAILAHICLPMFIWVAVFTILATQIWVSEMVFCDAVMEQQHQQQHNHNLLVFAGTGAVVRRPHQLVVVTAAWIWNRVVHPLWHMLTALLAWLIIQILIALHGMQQQQQQQHQENGGRTPVLRYWLAPYVAFDGDDTSRPSPPTAVAAEVRSIKND